MIAAPAKNKVSSQADELLELAGEVELFRSPDGVAFASPTIKGHRETWRLRSREFSRWLEHEFYTQHKSVPSAQAMRAALELLEGRAQHEGPEEPVYTRVAEKNNVVYLDLGDKDWRAVAIDPQGWRVIANPPVKFRRTRGMQSLPEPTHGGQIDELRRFVNVDSDDAFYLLVAWLVGALHPRGPFAILALQGEQGSAKSTTARLLRRLIDPSTAPTRRAPRDERDLMIAARNAWALSFDNLSGLPVWLSDGLCSLSTGGGFSTRALRTDDDEEIFSATRPIILNGIAGIAERSDLADRAVTVSLPSIPDDKRQDEATLRKAFEEAAPRILGALLDGVSAALRNIGRVTLATKPRMADFARWVSAAEEAFGWAPGTFMAAYTRNRAQTVEIALETDVVAIAVSSLLARCPGGSWEGSATALHAELYGLLPPSIQRAGDWPKAPNALTNRLGRIAPALRSIGIQYEGLPRSGKAGRRGLRLRHIGLEEIDSAVSRPGAATGDAPQPPESSVSVGQTVGLLGSAADGAVDNCLLSTSAETLDFDGESSRADDADDADDLSTGVVEIARPESTPPDLQVHREASSLPALAAAIRAAGKVGLSVAATGFEPRRDQSCAVAIALPNGDIHVIDLRMPHDVTPIIDAICDVIVVGHDLAPDIACIASDFGVLPDTIFDTQIACELIDAGVHGKDGSFCAFAGACTRFLGHHLTSDRSKVEHVARLSTEIADELADMVRPLLALEGALSTQLRHDGLDTFAELANKLLLAEPSSKFADTAGFARPEEIIALWTARVQVLQDDLSTCFVVDDPDDDADVLKELHRAGVPAKGVTIEDLVPFLNATAVGHLVRYRHLRDFIANVTKRVFVTMARPTPSSTEHK